MLLFFGRMRTTTNPMLSVNNAEPKVVRYRILPRDHSSN